MECSALFYSSLRSFIKDRCSILAASMSFFAIMAIVPFTLFIITLIGFVLGENPEMRDFIVSKILESFPDITRNITDEIAKLVTYKGLGIFGFLVYAYLSLRLMRTVEFALNEVFKIKDQRKIHHSIIISFGVITIMVLLFFFSFSATTIVIVPPFLKKYIPEFEISILTGIFIKFVMPFLLMWLIIVLLYLFLPIGKPRFRYTLKSALFVTLMLELAKHIFTWYIGNVVKLGHVYGPLTAFIIFFLWVYYSSCIFLFGAQMINVLSNKEEEVYEPSYW